MASELPLGDDQLLIRTDFSNEAAWDTIKTTMEQPAPLVGEVIPVTVIQDRQYAGLDAPSLLALLPSDHDYSVVLVADERAMTEADHPLLAVDPQDASGRSFRVIASEAWGPLANLPIANMDWEDFANEVDDEGVHRGFAE